MADIYDFGVGSKEGAILLAQACREKDAEIERLLDRIKFARAHLACIKDVRDTGNVQRKLTMAMDTLTLNPSVSCEPEKEPE